jgi:hypothetical protein
MQVASSMMCFGGRRVRGLRLGLAALVLILTAGQEPSGPKEPNRWLGVFRAFPGARRLCSQHVLGQSEGKRVEIHFTLYSTSRDPGDTARFYARAHGVPWESGMQTITVKLEDGRKILAVHAISAPHPECGIKPDSGDRTVIVVSEMVP